MKNSCKAPENCLFRYFFSPSLCLDCGKYCKSDSDQEEKKQIALYANNPGEMIYLALVA